MYVLIPTTSNLDPHARTWSKEFISSLLTLRVEANDTLLSLRRHYACHRGTLFLTRNRHHMILKAQPSAKCVDASCISSLPYSLPASSTFQILHILVVFLIKGYFTIPQRFCSIIEGAANTATP